MTNFVRVVKVGGSLFDLPDLRVRLETWLQHHPGKTALVAGGGDLADVIRNYDRRFALGEVKSHRLCIELLHVAALVLKDILGDVPLGSDLFAPPPAPVVILSPRQFLTKIEPSLPGPPLPSRWDVTTDSIAARVAKYLAVRELVLLKSKSPPDQPVGGVVDLGGWAGEGYIDGYFPQAVGGIDRLAFVDLRSDPPFVERRLIANHSQGFWMNS